MTEGERWSPERAAEVARLLADLAELPEGSAERQHVRERLVEAHLPLVHYFARRFVHAGVPLEDLVQIGSLGLIKAIDRFDPTLGHELASYVAPIVAGEIKRYLRDSSGLVRVPRRAYELQGAVARAREDLSQELGHMPTVSQLAERVGASPDEVVEALDVNRARDPEPLEAFGRDADSGDAGAGVARLLAFDDPGFDTVELRADLQEAMGVLDDLERQVVLLRFRSGRTQTEIADVLGVSQMQISRMLRRSLARMRAALEG